MSVIKKSFEKVMDSLTERMEALLKIKSIPEVVQKESLIRSMINGKYLFDNFSLENCEYVRKELRGLMQFIPDRKSYYLVNADDYVLETDSNEEFVKKKTYHEKVMEYLSKNTPTIVKLQSLDELTDAEKEELKEMFTVKLGTMSEYAAWSNNVPMLPFLRAQVGISDEAIQTKFGSFYNKNTLNEEQMEYMAQIINYARENGDITFKDLQSASPFCDVDIMDLFGEKVVLIKNLINGLHKPVM